MEDGAQCFDDLIEYFRNRGLLGPAEDYQNDYTSNSKLANDLSNITSKNNKEEIDGKEQEK